MTGAFFESGEGLMLGASGAGLACLRLVDPTLVSYLAPLP
jgi:hypothetical protein